ncbi:hypothetical protein GCM10007913_40470 [Devosia yakushimensis]|uniref:2-dehydropantoate 2-reductase n=1 Tax=Devosia yakushimensis TaxID=470028 RepID=A0ABQ5ULQ2_9HYPH|nr:NAD/NADP octopine/nopaline dehydrogenase family protein [Devosia yakushimensis]GLQ12115.1 hypothetical protein GCM10007913_40470 [Devosia yakushimensis]
MKVTVLGAGGIAFGMAAFLVQKGNEVTLWSPSGKSTEGLGDSFKIQSTGALEGDFEVAVAHSARSAVENADVIILAVPGYGHKYVIDAVAPWLTNNQSFIYSSHSSFGALYLSKCLAERKVALPIIVWGTTLLMSKRSEGTQVYCKPVREEIDVGTVPESAIDHGMELCTRLFGDVFKARDGLMAIALSNLNPQSHLALGLLNLTRIERGEAWNQNENLTRFVANVILALDNERLALAAAFGLKVRTQHEHFALSRHVPMGDYYDMNQEFLRRSGGVMGPSSPNTRYVLEDVPFGLFVTTILTRLVGQNAETHEAGIKMMSTAYGQDLTELNDLVPAIGLDKMTKAELFQKCKAGW